MLKTENQITRAHYDDDKGLKSLTGNLNANVMIRSLSTPVLNDFKVMEGVGIAYNPNIRDELLSAAKKEMDEFLANAFDRIVALKARAPHMIEATRKERNELDTSMSNRRRRSSM